MASPSEEYVATDAGEPTLTRAPPRHGNTCEGRLRVLDAFLQAYDPRLFDEDATSASFDGPVDIFMDVGLGDGPWTLLEFADLLAARRNSGTLKVVGTECDPERLAAAVAALPDPRPPMLDLRLAETTGWFRLPVLPTETLLCLRVMNVLRDYHPADAQRAFGVLAAQLPAGALMVEGTCDGDGDRACVALASRSGDASTLVVQGIAFLADLTQHHATGSRAKVWRRPPPHWFRLPQAWMHEDPHAPNALRCFLTQWKQAAESVRADVAPAIPRVRDWWQRSAHRLAAEDPNVVRNADWLDRGWLVWTPPPDLLTFPSLLTPTQD